MVDILFKAYPMVPLSCRSNLAGRFVGLSSKIPLFLFIFHNWIKKVNFSVSQQRKESFPVRKVLNHVWLDVAYGFEIKKKTEKISKKWQLLTVLYLFIYVYWSDTSLALVYIENGFQYKKMGLTKSVYRRLEYRRQNKVRFAF